MCGYVSIWLMQFMLKGKCLFDYVNLFPPNEYEKNNEIILKYIQ